MQFDNRKRKPLLILHFIFDFLCDIQKSVYIFAHIWYNEKKDIIEEFYYRDKYGYILTEKELNYNINIEECYNLWYNDDYKGKFELYEEDLILLGAAMMVEKEEDFSNIIRMVRMKPEIIELMEGLVKEMNHDEKLVNEYKIWKNEDERIITIRGACILLVWIII